MSTAAGSETFEWRTVPLGDIADIKLGKMLDRSKHTTGRKVPYLRNVNVRWGAIETDDVLEMYFDDDELERFGLKENDVLVCEGGEPGRAAVWKGGPAELKFQKALHRVRFKVPFEPRLLVYLLEILAKNGGLERRFTGSTIKHFTREAFLQLPVPLLPVTEQQRIVWEIEKQFTRLEAGVIALNRAKANLKRYRASILVFACEGRLMSTQPEDQNATYESGVQLLKNILETRREDARNRGKYKEPAAVDSSHFAALPKGWTWSNLEQLTQPNRASAYGVLQPGEDVAGGVPFVRVGDIDNGRVKVANLKRISPQVAAEYPRTKLQGGELAITLVGAIGRTAVIPSSLAGGNVARAVGIIPLTPYVNTRWVEIWFRNPGKVAEMLSKSHEVARKTLNLEDVRLATVAVPPLAEQQRIVDEVERRLSVVDELETAVEANLQRAARLRLSILQRAFLGNL